MEISPPATNPPSNVVLAVANVQTEKELKLFARHPSIKEVYKTEDGTYFLKKSVAESHANGLASSSVVTIKKSK